MITCTFFPLSKAERRVGFTTPCFFFLAKGISDFPDIFDQMTMPARGWHSGACGRAALASTAASLCG
jgi:hypothetical protein